MGLRVLIGEADGTIHAAAMYCSTTGVMVGYIWEGDGAEEALGGFLNWLERLSFVTLADEIGLEPHDLQMIGRDGSDPRHWPESGLEKLTVYFRRSFVDADGNLDWTKQQV
jgi:hypothetical protein